MTSTNPEVSTTSAKQAAANRRNAQHSTGPRTQPGKAISSRNAVTHGATAMKPIAVSRGVLAENQDELDVFVTSFMDAPRDQLEAATQALVGQFHLQLCRTGRYEAEVLAGSGRVEPGHKQQVATAKHTMVIIELIITTLKTPHPRIGYDYEPIVSFLLREHHLDGPYAKKLWDARPTTAEQWRAAFVAVCDHVWAGDRPRGIAWAEQRRDRAHAELDDLHGVDVETAAMRALDAMARVSTIQARIIRNLKIAMQDYRELRARDLPPATTTPTGVTVSPAGDDA